MNWSKYGFKVSKSLRLTVSKNWMHWLLNTNKIDKRLTYHRRYNRSLQCYNTKVLDTTLLCLPPTDWRFPSLNLLIILNFMKGIKSIPILIFSYLTYIISNYSGQSSVMFSALVLNSYKWIPCSNILLYILTCVGIVQR